MSIAGEIVPSGEFYDYESKYLDEGSKLLIPAPIRHVQLAWRNTEALRRLAFIVEGRLRIAAAHRA